MKLEELPYFKIFNEQERTVARCGAFHRCKLCLKILFYTDIMNLSDFYPIMTMVCEECKNKHQTTFDEKRKEYFDKTETTDKKRL